MKKTIFILTLVTAFMVSQVLFAQDKPVEKKVDKVAKIKEKKESTEKMECCKDKKCCDKCTEENCAKSKKEGAAKCEMGKKEKCTMDSTVKCEKKHMEKKAVIKKDIKTEDKK